MEADLPGLRETLVDINELLSLSSDSDVRHMSTLKSFVEEAIALKELEEKNQPIQSSVAPPSSVSDPTHSPLCGVGASNVGFADVAVNVDLSGRRCSFFGWTSRGYFIRQNAVVAGTVYFHEGTRYLRVFLANPTRPTDIPCRAFLEHGTCENGSLCRFSHGTVVPLEDVSEWYEPSSSLYLTENQLCLALPLSTDIPLWRHAFILHADIKSGTCVVEWIASKELDIFDKVANLPFSHIHPFSESYSASFRRLDFSLPNSLPLRKTLEILDEDSDDLNGGGASEHNVNSSLDKVLEPNGLTSPICHQDHEITQNNNLGYWEVHTRGIGSYLLRKMGYNGEGGLGRRGTGRRLPVSMDRCLHQIDLQESGRGPPQRPSIDRLIELRDRGPGRASTKNASNMDTSAACPDHLGSDFYSGSVFDFLNNRVLAKSTDRESKSSHKIADRISLKSSKTGKDLSIEIYDIQREIRSLTQEISRTTESIQRNKRDRKVIEAAKLKLGEQTQRLRRLRERESHLAVQAERQKNVTKLRIF